MAQKTKLVIQGIQRIARIEVNPANVDQLPHIIAQLKKDNPEIEWELKTVFE